MCIATSAVLQERCLCNGAIGGVVDIVSRVGERPPESLPAFFHARFPKYLGPVDIAVDPKVAPFAPIGRLLGCRRRCSRLVIPLAPAWGVTFRKSHGMTCGAGRDVEGVVVRPPTPSFVKSLNGGLYTAFSRAKSAWCGSYGEPWYEPSALYLQPL